MNDFDVPLNISVKVKKIPSAFHIRLIINEINSPHLSVAIIKEKKDGYPPDSAL